MTLTRRHLIASAGALALPALTLAQVCQLSA